MASAFLAGTSTEFIGGKPLPRATRERALLFVLGPAGSGKSLVARRFAGPGALELDNQGLAAAVTVQTRRRCWSAEHLEVEALILDGPCFLDERVGYARAVGELLRIRTQAGRRTVVTEPGDGSTLRLLLDAVDMDQRATVLLRFPVGRGRRRHALRVCEELGLDSAMARRVSSLQPWSYEAVRKHLVELAQSASEAQVQASPPPGQREAR